MPPKTATATGGPWSVPGSSDSRIRPVPAPGKDRTSAVATTRAVAGSSCDCTPGEASIRIGGSSRAAIAVGATVDGAELVASTSAPV